MSTHFKSTLTRSGVVFAAGLASVIAAASSAAAAEARLTAITSL